MKTACLTFVLAHLIYVVVCAAEVRQKRDLDMLRMGRRSRSIPPLVRPAYDDLDEEMAQEEVTADIDERQAYTIPRMGKDIDELSTIYRLARIPPVPRLGEMARLQQFLAQYRRDVNDEQLRQVYMNIPRVGRRVRRSTEGIEKREKRAIPVPRLGQRQLTQDETKSQEVKRDAPLDRLGMFAARAVPVPRLGLRSSSFGKYDIDDDDVYWSGGALYDADSENSINAGKGSTDDVEGDDSSFSPETRAVPVPRLGLMTKKAVGMLRMGRSGESSGKRAMGMLRMGKRGMGMLRMGKRGMGMLRMGKRGMGMLRMGRDNESAKRAVSMLRMGKRPMGMLRMGKRGMGMLRMGKKAMGMLRMGKRSVDTENSSTE